MKTRRPLRYVITRTGGRAGSGRRESSAGTARAVLGRGLLVPAFVLVAIGTGAAALPGHGVSGAGQAPAHRHIAAHAASSCVLGRTTRTAAAAGPVAAISFKPQIPWMYAVFAGEPIMSASPSKIPWMYSSIRAARSACPAGTAAGRTRV